MYAFLGLIAMAGFFVSIILLVVDAVKKRGKKKHLISLVAFVVLFFVAIAITPSTDSTPDTNNAVQTDTVDENTSDGKTSNDEQLSKDELNAQKLKDGAKENFDDGLYDSAFTKCNKILSDYSGTEVAASIPDFLNELYNSAINITAADLRKAYDANEVNADSTYNGKTVVVTGTVTDIGKDITDAAYITLQDGSSYDLTSIQCYFKDDKSEDVGAVTAGSSIKIIGECSGESINILIKNCYIIG